MGTDSKGNYMQSSAMRFGAFNKYSVEDLYYSASTTYTEVKEGTKTDIDKSNEEVKTDEGTGEGTTPVESEDDKTPAETPETAETAETAET